ncbi:hypothetical protein ANN_16403 [Periplaneta americana]|uniref:Uncharacterized protein n=1 Tax=Periplaneta americana TaxID=6978 RepID=A0ABQ8SIV2_PERAM|nr:hypothetical protein ANN_16403 [Periplaneta americana]
MSPGSSTESYPAFARIRLRENPGKDLNQVTCPNWDSNPGHLVSRPDALTVTPKNNAETDQKKKKKLTRSLAEKKLPTGKNGGPKKSSLLSKNLKVRIYKTVILPVVLYGCETWTLTLTGEQRLRVFENKVLRKIFGAKRDEVTGEWRKLHNAELHALYPSPDIIRNIKSRRLRWAGHVARMGESRNAYRVLVGRPEGKRPLGRPRRRWEDNIKMDLREVGYDDRDWINLAQDRDQWRAYVRAAMNLRSLMLAGSEFQSLGRAIVKEDEYEEVRWDDIVSIVSWRERMFRLWWEERQLTKQQPQNVSLRAIIEFWNNVVVKLLNQSQSCSVPGNKCPAVPIRILTRRLHSQSRRCDGRHLPAKWNLKETRSATSNSVGSALNHKMKCNKTSEIFTITSTPSHWVRAESNGLHKSIAKGRSEAVVPIVAVLSRICEPFLGRVE